LTLLTAIAACVNAGALFYILRKQGVFQAQTGWLNYGFKVLLATGLMVAVLWFLMPELTWWKDAAAFDRILWLVALIVAALGSFFVGLLGLRVNIKRLIRH